MDKKKCNKPGTWHDGSCCCNCQHRYKVYCSPWNKTIGHGSISKILGYGCLALYNMEDKKGIIFSEREHGFCECYISESHSRPKDING